jgi:hypothetical protein
MQKFELEVGLLGANIEPTDSIYIQQQCSSQLGAAQLSLWICGIGLHFVYKFYCVF